MRLTARIGLALLAAGVLLAAGHHRAAEPTDAGTWNGSWFLADVSERIALFVRGPADSPELRIQYERQDGVERFTSEWNGGASYFVAGRPAAVELTVEERDARRIRGHWRRSFFDGAYMLEEQGPFTLQRSGNGRWAAMRFDDLKLTRRADDGTVQERTIQRTWHFRKASRRVVRWEELPR